MEIQGTLKQILPLESGESKSGKAWQKQTIIVETQETYPKLIAVEVNEKAINRLQDYQIEQTITCSINIESREYNGRWFTSVKAWKI
jgi:tRNA U34 2-thiouridine synthase MnmA/TrmU